MSDLATGGVVVLTLLLLYIAAKKWRLPERNSADARSNPASTSSDDVSNAGDANSVDGINGAPTLGGDTLATHTKHVGDKFLGHDQMV